jgi:tetratricopeptide (TPR) repeat protein
LLFVVFSAVGQQTKQQLEDIYKDANAYFYFEDYEEALALYLKIYNQYTDNFNLDYRIGICYLNIPGRKHKAINHLERAAQNINRRYNEQLLRETRAPLDAIFYLGNAYYINGYLDKAQQTYDLFLSQIRNERRYDMEYFKHQVDGIKRSRVIQNYPVNFMRSNLGETINNNFPNYNPVVSGDGRTLAYTTKQRFYQAIFVARKEGNDWGKPQNITLDLVVDGNCSTLSLSYTGDELYLFKDVDHVGNIYVSNFKEGKWSPMKKLNENINTSYYETHACVSADGTKLYFASNRMSGYGDMDIYVSEREPNGDWGPAKNMGSNVNTRFNENTPFLTTNGNTLFFSSEGHNSMGGYDIFFSQKQNDGSWSKPINLGFPINSTDDDLFYHPIGDGSMGLMALFGDDAYGETDIYQIEIYLPKYQKSIISSSDFYTKKDDLPKKTLVVDTLNLRGVALLDPSKPEHLEYLNSDKKFTLFFDGRGYKLKDQSKLAEALKGEPISKITDHHVPIKPSSSVQDITTPPEKDEIIDIETIKQTQTDIDKSTLVSISNEPQIPLDSTVIEASDKTLRTSDTVKTRSNEVVWLTEILRSLADDNIKKLINDELVSAWEISPSLLKLHASKLAYTADSLSYSAQFMDLFAEIIDKVNLKSADIHFRQSRKISPTSQIEDFFFKLQVLKRKASPGLAELLDYAILTNPKISSFASLWDFLNKQMHTDTSSYLKELVSLYAENAIEGYFSLTYDQKENLFLDLQDKKIAPSIPLLLGSGLAIAVLVIFLVITKRKRKKANTTVV